MQEFALSSAVIIGLTLFFVSGIRKLWPKVDGKWLVLACGTAVGIGLSFLAAYITAQVQHVEMMTTGLVISRGAGAAAAAFGYANWRTWSSAQLPVPMSPVVQSPSTQEKP